MKFRLQDPFSGLTHLGGALLGVVALVYLVRRSLTEATPTHTLSFTIYGLSLIGLYSSSAFYHLVPANARWERVLRSLDHSMIFLLIAGSYTPFCLVTLWNHHGYELLATVWTLTFLGIGQAIFWTDGPRWLRTGLYLFLGWIAVVAI